MNAHAADLALAAQERADDGRPPLPGDAALIAAHEAQLQAAALAYQDATQAADRGHCGGCRSCIDPPGCPYNATALEGGTDEACDEHHQEDGDG